MPQYEVRAADAVYERNTLEAALGQARAAAHRTRKAVGVWLPDGTYWAVVEPIGKRDTVRLRFREVDA